MFLMHEINVFEYLKVMNNKKNEKQLYCWIDAAYLQLNNEFGCLNLEAKVGGKSGSNKKLNRLEHSLICICVANFYG